MKYRVMAMNESEVAYKDQFEGKDFKIITDEKRNAMDTWQRKLLSAGDEACVFMEDDIDLCEDFINIIEGVIAENPDRVISFFTLKNITETTKMKGRTYMMNQCYYLPKGLADRIYIYSFDWLLSKRGVANPTGNDTCIADFLKDNKIDYWIYYPNLVQHHEAKSRIGPRSSKRQTKIFKDDIV